MTPFERRNEFDQPIGPALPNWIPRAQPPRTPIAGRFCTLEPVDPARHARDLHEAFHDAPDGRDWTYLASERFETLEAYTAYLANAATQADPLHHAVIDHATGRAVGTLALMRIDAGNGVIEVGHVAYSPRLKRTPMGTEAQYLLMRRVFDELGYRRYEWKCDSFNAPSRRAAARYGFQFEGIFRQAVVVKGRSRDTAWFSMLDHEWQRLRPAYEAWLSPANFDDEGRQRAGLADLIARQRSEV